MMNEFGMADSSNGSRNEEHQIISNMLNIPFLYYQILISGQNMNDPPFGATINYTTYIFEKNFASQ